MRISFITNYAGHTGFRDYIQTSFIINHNCADYADVHDNMKNNFITDYADYTTFQYQIRNNFITDYADYASFIYYIKK